jgi:hypothetical protein
MVDGGSLQNQRQKGAFFMGVVAYAGMAYGLTAVISLAVIGLIVIMDKVMGKGNTEDEGGTDE